MSRIILISDTHLCHIDWYGVGTAARLEKMTADLADEYAREPYGMILMLGDYSLDYWECGPRYGDYHERGISNTAKFLREYASRFPAPTYFVPGNHEQYTPEDWERLTGSKRQFYVIWNGYIFFMLDTFGDKLNIAENNHGTYSYADTAYIKTVMAAHPGMKAFLCAHDIYREPEKDEFKRLVRENGDILAMFGGHTHQSEVVPMGAEFGGKCLYRTGNYSYSGRKDPTESMWGYRELRFEDNHITTKYITPDNKIISGAKEVYHHRSTQDSGVIA